MAQNKMIVNMRKVVLVLWIAVNISLCSSADGDLDEDFQSLIDNLNSERQSDLKTRSITFDMLDNSIERNKSDESLIEIPQTTMLPVELNDNNNLDDQVLERISEVINSLMLNNSRCQRDLNATVFGARQGQHWALAMYDASVKMPLGIEFGQTYQLGNFDECMRAFHHHSRQEPLDQSMLFRPQYCLADVLIEGFSIGSISSRDYHIRKPNSTTVHWGLCLPDSCHYPDAQKLLASLTGHQVTIEKGNCYSETHVKPLSNGEIAFICIMVGFFLIVIFSTIYNIYLNRNKTYTKHGPKSTPEAIVASFSMLENLKKLFRVGSDDLGLGCVNGIKAVGMFFILAGHSLVFMIGGPVKNAEFYAEQTKLIQNAFLLNSPLLVDTFLLLSGFLFARLLLLELEKRKGKINFILLYIFRYIRLTPAYLAVITLYATVLPRLGSGPLWNKRMELEKERCQESWWTNILYINNYVGTDKLCMFQSWYLSADTQLFLLAPIVLYPLWRFRKLGFSILISLTVITTLIPFLVTFFQELDPTFLVFAEEVPDLSLNPYFIQTYIKTHMRATAYVFGLLTGFIVHIMQEKNFRLSKKLQRLFWITSLVAGIGSMFSITIFFYPNYKYSIFESALYAGLHRLGWSYMTGWIVLACVTGYAENLKNILGAKPLVPASRLTYCAYLTNGLVELYQFSTLRSPKYLSIMNLLGSSLSHICLTFLAALFLCLMFESPIHGLEKILLRRESQKSTKGDENDNNQHSASQSTTSMSEESG